MIHQWEMYVRGVCETSLCISNMVIWVDWFHLEPSVVMYSPTGTHVGAVSDLLGDEPIEIVIDV